MYDYEIPSESFTPDRAIRKTNYCVLTTLLKAGLPVIFLCSDLVVGVVLYVVIQLVVIKTQ